METSAAKKIHVFRGEEAILNILADYKKSKLTIKAFCIEHNIASASFHNCLPASRQGKRNTVGVR